MKKLLCFSIIFLSFILSAQNNVDYYTGQTEVTTSSGCRYIVEHWQFKNPLDNAFYIQKTSNTLSPYIYDITTNQPIIPELRSPAHFDPNEFKEIVMNVLSERDYCLYNSLPKGNIHVEFRVNPRTEQLMEISFTIWPRGDNALLSFSPDQLERLEQAFFGNLHFHACQKNASIQLNGCNLFDKIIDY